MPSSIRIDITINEAQLDFLTKFCKKENVSRSQLIRLALGEYMRNHKDGIGLPKSDQTLEEIKDNPAMMTATQLKPLCQNPNVRCKNRAIGHFGITYFDGENERTNESWLCDIHLKQAKAQQGAEVIELPE